MKSLLLVVCFTFTSLFVGCADKKPEVVYVHTDCPRFTKSLDIQILKEDDEFAKIHWYDVKKLKDLSEAKKAFNKIVQDKNNENRAKLKEALRTKIKN